MGHHRNTSSISQDRSRDKSADVSEDENRRPKTPVKRDDEPRPTTEALPKTQKTPQQRANELKERLLRGRLLKMRGCPKGGPSNV